MRNRQVFKNMLSNLLLQLVIMITGFILPRFILSEYGSAMNGLISSITQFLAYMGLAEAGVGAASIVALYAPLAQSNTGKVNSILTATKNFYLRSGYLFAGLAGGLVLLYPLFLKEQMDASTIRFMVVILASSTLVDYFFLGKYKVFLTASQRGYIVANIQSIGTIANTIISILLISEHANVLWVKGVATVVYILRFFAIKWYVKKHFPDIRFNSKTPDNSALHQRWAALVHQVTGIVVNNTAIVVLTVLLGKNSLLEVSVYTIYNMIVSAIFSLLNSFSNALTAGFGDMISKKETDNLKSAYSNYEYMFFVVLFTAFSCVGILLLPFVSVYTQGITDASYMRPVVAILFTIIVLLQNIRIPGLTIISAAGHFKETRKQAIIEAVINIVVSVSLVGKFGMAGILVGTICSYGYRSFDIIIYTAKHFVSGTGKNSAFRIIRNVVTSVVIWVVGYQFTPVDMASYFSWFVYAILWGGISVVVIIVENILFEPHEFKMLIQRFTGVFKK